MATEKSQLKVKKKTWYPVFTNQAFGETFIGELPLTEPNLLLGRHIMPNLMNLTGNPKNQNINLKFKVEKVMGSKGIAYPVSYTMISSTIKRIVRRKKDKIDDSFICQTADGIKVKLKPLIVTRNQTANSVLTEIRKLVRTYLTTMTAGSNYITLFSDVLSYRVQKVLRDNVKKLYPLAVCEIRVLEVVSGQTLANIGEEVRRAAILNERVAPVERKETSEKPVQSTPQSVPEEKPAQEETTDTSDESVS